MRRNHNLHKFQEKSVKICKNVQTPASPEGDKVFVVREGKVFEKRVTAGVRRKDRLQILEGLEAGDEVVVYGVQQIRPRMEVATQLIP